MLDYYEIGLQVRAARKNRGLSQEELAEKVGISVTHMSHIETGNTKLSLQVLADLASALSVSTDSLLFPPSASTKTMQAEMNQIFSNCTEQQAIMLMEIVQLVKKVLDKYR